MLITKTSTFSTTFRIFGLTEIGSSLLLFFIIWLLSMVGLVHSFSIFVDVEKIGNKKDLSKELVDCCKKPFHSVMFTLDSSLRLLLFLVGLLKMLPIATVLGSAKDELGGDPLFTLDFYNFRSQVFYPLVMAFGFGLTFVWLQLALMHLGFVWTSQAD